VLASLIPVLFTTPPMTQGIQSLFLATESNYGSPPFFERYNRRYFVWINYLLGIPINNCAFDNESRGI